MCHHKKSIHGVIWFRCKPKSDESPMTFYMTRPEPLQEEQDFSTLTGKLKIEMSLQDKTHLILTRFKRFVRNYSILVNVVIRECTWVSNELQTLIMKPQKMSFEISRKEICSSLLGCQLLCLLQEITALFLESNLDRKFLYCQMEHWQYWLINSIFS